MALSFTYVSEESYDTAQPLQSHPASDPILDNMGLSGREARVRSHVRAKKCSRNSLRVKAMDALLTLPGKVLYFASSSVILATCAIATYFLVFVGYPRLPWTHHTLNTANEAATAVNRIFRAIETIEANMHQHPQLPEAFKRAYGNEVAALIKTYSQLRGKGAHPNPEVVGKGVDAILGTGLHAPSGTASSLMHVASTIASSKSALMDVVRQEDSDEVKRIACAITEIRLVAGHVIPSLVKVHREKTRRYTQMEIISHHVQPQIDVFSERVTAAFDVRKSGSENERAQKVISYLSALGKKLMAT